MIDVYSIGVTLKLTDLVAPQLLKLSEQFAKVDALALQVNKRLQKMGAEVVGMRNLAGASKTLEAGLKGVNAEALLIERNLRGIKGALPSGLGLEKELTRANVEADLLEKKLAGMRALGRGPGGGGGGVIPPILPAPGGGHGGGRRGHLHGGNIHMSQHGVGVGGIGMGMAEDALIPLAAAGVAVYIGHAAVKEAAEYQREQAQFSIFGMSAEQNAQAKTYVEQTQMPGASMIDKMRYMTEAQGVFRESGMSGDEALGGAKLVAPILAKLHYTSLLSGHEMDETEEKSMLRFVETRGGLKDPAELKRIADLGFKVSMTSGGNVDWEQLRQAMSTGGVAAKGLTDEALFAWGEPLIGELKGGGFGTGLRTAFNRMNGIIKLPNQAFHEMERLGIWDASKVEENKSGGIKSFKGNPLIHADEYSANPFKYYTDYILPKYDKLGLSEADRNRENSMIFGGTGSRLFSTLEQQLSTILKSLPALNQAKGLDPAVKTTDDTMTGQMKNFDAAWSDFKNQFGQTMLPAVTNMLLVGTSILRTINEWAANPMTAAKAQIDQVPQADHPTVGRWGKLGDLFHWNGDASGEAPSPAKSSQSHAAQSVGPQSAQGGTAYTTINLDGKKIAEAVSPFMADHLSRQSTSLIDSGVSLPMPGIK